MSSLRASSKYRSNQVTTGLEKKNIFDIKNGVFFKKVFVKCMQFIFGSLGKNYI